MDTATTDIYTYGHTLSLHDALPISRSALSAPPRGCRRHGPCPDLDSCGSLRRCGLRRDAGSRPAGMLIVGGEPRSEEHTSELQSLMRISYAVFCLKKKNHLSDNNTTQTDDQ